jgi:acyl-ACP thioesterase
MLFDGELMEIFTKNLIVNMSQCDKNAQMRELDIFSTFLDSATEHGKLMGVAAPDLAKFNLFWVITKNKFRFYRKPCVLQNYSLTTWPKKPDLIRSNRFCEFFDDNGVFAQAKSEWVMLDKSSFKVSKHSVAYPNDLVHSEKTILDEPWLKVNNDFSTCDFEYNYLVNSQDIDLSQHMNNIAYLRAMFSVLSSDKINSLNILEMEVHYLRQCFEGDNLSIRFIATDYGFMVGFTKENQLCTFINVIVNK